MSSHPFAEKNVQRYIDEIRSVTGVAAFALVSCEGTIIGKHFPDGSITSSIFAAMSATVLASAEAVCATVGIDRPSLVTISSKGAAILIVGIDEVALITAVIDKPADLPGLERELLDIAARIREEVA